MKVICFRCLDQFLNKGKNVYGTPPTEWAENIFLRHLGLGPSKTFFHEITDKEMFIINSSFSHAN